MLENVLRPIRDAQTQQSVVNGVVLQHFSYCIWSEVLSRMKCCLVLGPHALVILLTLHFESLLYFSLEIGVMLEKMPKLLVESVVHLANKGVIFDLLIQASTLE